MNLNVRNLLLYIYKNYNNIILINYFIIYKPSLYSALRSLKYGVSDAPHVGIFKLLHDPLKVLYFAFGSHITTGAHIFK